jgi:hypothetical protein
MMKHSKQTVIYSIVAIVFGFCLFAAGVVTGISYEGRLGQWSRNIDMSDYISMSLIALLSVALWLSLRRNP